MLLAGSTDGVYRVTNPRRPAEATTERILAADEVFRIRQFDGVEGIFATSASGLYHSPDGSEWRAVSVPADDVYAIAADPRGRRLYAGTRPARVYVADCADGVPLAASNWEELSGFERLRSRRDWGIPRHDGVAQVRRLFTHPEAPRRLVAGIEVGGVYVSDDRGETWEPRRIEGYDAPHTDDVHHLAVAGPDAWVASTGSGLYRTTDAGRSWTRLDADARQRYFRAAFVHDGTVHAGGAPRSAASWETDPDHALFRSSDGDSLSRLRSPVPDEVAVGWTAIGDDVLAATHRGTLLRRRAEGWERVGAVPVRGHDLARYLPLSWVDPQSAAVGRSNRPETA